MFSYLTDRFITTAPRSCPAASGPVLGVKPYTWLLTEFLREC